MLTRFFTYIAVLISFVFATPSFADSKLLREWKLSKVYVAGLKAQKGTTLKFDESQYYMFAGCNRFFGGYEKAESGGKFNIQLGVSTRKLCPGNYEKFFAKVLFSTDKYEIKQNHLILYSNGKKILKFGK